MGFCKNGGADAVCHLPPTEDQITDTIHIDVTQIPNYVRDSLAAATLEAYKRSMQNPKIREKIERKSERRRAAALAGR